LSGRTLLLLRSLGYSDASIRTRIVRYYPALLARHPERDIHPRLEHLAALGVAGRQLRLLLWEHPRVLAVPNYRRVVRSLQLLGLYGLPPPAERRDSRGGHDSLAALLATWQS
jgi:mTERF